VIQGRQTCVLAFAQSPKTARATTQVNLREKSALVLVQGVAWVDADSYQIIRMRVDLLAPRRDIGLQRQTTEILYMKDANYTALRALYDSQSQDYDSLLQKHSDLKTLAIELCDKFGATKGIFVMAYHFSTGLNGMTVTCLANMTL
jgi:hypothetical protein